MQIARLMFLAGSAIFLAACSTGPSRVSDDPAAKLALATDLFQSKEQPVAAERLIREAMRAYEAKGDQVGVADAYGTYGTFFRSHGVAVAESKYRKDGFLDPTADFDRRYAKALEYHLKARDIYASRKRYDRLAGIYVAIAADNSIVGRRQAACTALDQSMESYRQSQQEPKSEVSVPAGFKTFDEYWLSLKKDARCM